jgi:HK97 family phage major capsid protein
MQKVLEFRAHIKALKEEGNGLLGKLETEKRAMTADERTKFDSINKEIDGLEARMDDYIKVNRIPEEELRGGTITPQAAPKATKPSFRSVGEQLQAVANFYTGRSVDNRLMEYRAATGINEAVPSQGGFLVQTDLAGELLKAAYDTSAVANKVRKIQIGPNSNGMNMKTIDETSRATGSRWGGVQVYWEAEADSTTNKLPKFGRFELNLAKIMGMCYTTDEMMQDAAQLGSIVTQAFSEEIGFKLSDGVFRGTGAGQMLGVLNSDALLSVVKDAGQTADTVSSTNILGMWKSCMGRSTAYWFYNQELEDQLSLLTYPIGTGGVMANLFRPPMTPGSDASIMGRPAIAVEQASGPGDVGDILLMDPSQYIIIDKNGLQTAESIHVAFLTDQSVFRFIYRCNGAPTLKSKITPYKRTSTSFFLSPYCAIAAR